MSKFNLGDRVRVAKRGDMWNKKYMEYLYNTEQVVGSIDSKGRPEIKNISGAGGIKSWVFNDSDLELITKGDNKVKQCRTFKLIKNTPLAHKGALYQEKCDDGTQPYEMINAEDFAKEAYSNNEIETRSLVEEQPEWFVEVFKVTPEYMTQEELDQWEAFKKPAKRGVGRPKGSKIGSKMGTKKKYNRSEAMKASWARRKANNV